MCNYWLHRISYHKELSYPLLISGYLSIGFSDFSNVEFINDICNESSRRLFEKKFKGTWKVEGRNKNYLWKFIIKMKKGDYIFVPERKCFSVFKVEEDNARLISDIDLAEIIDCKGNKFDKNENGLIYNTNGELIDLGFIRKVKLIKKDIPRNKCSSALTSILKIRHLNSDISGFKNILKTVIELDAIDLL